MFRDVVRSMLNFHRVAGFQLVEKNRRPTSIGYARLVGAFQAEAAYGTRVGVASAFYSAVVDHPESAMACVAGLCRRYVLRPNA